MSHTFWRRAVIIGSVFVLVIALGGLTGCSKPAETPATQESTQPAEQPATSTPAESSVTDPGTATDPVTELKIEDIDKGKGDEVKSGDNVTVHYTGWLTDGTKFDSSLDSGQPFQFTVGAGQVIAGWDEGLVGMKPGGIRKLTIPPDMGYGDQGAGGVIPPGATLVFEVQLVSID